MLGRVKRSFVVLFQELRELTSHSKKIRADAETLRSLNMELAREDQESVAQATAVAARLKAVAEVVASVRWKLFDSGEERANSPCSAHNNAEGAIKVKGDVRKELIAVLGEVADVIEQKASLNG